MRRHRFHGNNIGCLVSIMGCIVLLALFMPAGIWWFLLGVGLIIGGIWIRRCC